MKLNLTILSKQDTWIRPFFKKYKKLLLLVLGLGVLTYASAAGLMFTSGYLISKSAAKPENILMVYVPVVLTRLFGISRPSFRYVERLNSHNWVLKMTSDIRLKLYRALESQAARSKEHHQSGEVVALLSEDIEHIQNLYLRTIFPVCVSWIIYILIVLVLGYFSWPFACLMGLLFMVLLFILPLVSLLVNQAKIYRKKEQTHKLYQDLTDAVLGVSDWKYSGKYDLFLDNHSQSESNLRLEDAALKRYSRYEGLIKQLVFGFIAVSLIIWSAYYFADFGTSSALNWIAAFVLSFFPLIDAFAPVSDSIREAPIYEDSLQRLSQLPAARKLPDNTQHVALNDSSIKVDNLSFQFSENQKMLVNHVTFEVLSGQTIAIIGKSGTGKTTLTQLIRGELTPTTGNVEIGGIPVSQLNEYQSHYFGVLNQSPYLFNTTIKHNVRLGKLDATDEQILEALKKAGLESMIDRLPEGMDTMVEEGGKRFSGGEQQRIALARILLQDVPIVIIDEPTIGLDPITEKALLDVVFEALKDKTVIWITHHLMGIHHADRVLFLEKGSITLDGSLNELIENNSKFKELYEMDVSY